MRTRRYNNIRRNEYSFDTEYDIEPVENLHFNSYQRYCENKSKYLRDENNKNKNGYYRNRAEITNNHNIDMHDNFYRYNDNYTGINARYIEKPHSYPRKAVLLNIISIIMFILIGVMTIYNVRLNHQNETDKQDDKQIDIIDESMLEITSDGNRLIYVKPVYKY